MGYLLVATTVLQAQLNNRLSVSAMRRVAGFDTWEEALHEDGLVYYKTEELGSVDTEFGDLAGQVIGKWLSHFSAFYLTYITYSSS